MSDRRPKQPDIAGRQQEPFLTFGMPRDMFIPMPGDAVPALPQSPPPRHTRRDCNRIGGVRDRVLGTASRLLRSRGIHGASDCGESHSFAQPRTTTRADIRYRDRRTADEVTDKFSTGLLHKIGVLYILRIWKRRRTQHPSITTSAKDFPGSRQPCEATTGTGQRQVG